jgi:hypothetical protein
MYERHSAALTASVCTVVIKILSLRYGYVKYYYYSTFVTLNQISYELCSLLSALSEC